MFHFRYKLEEQRLAIEKHYEEKLESMRREMESRNEQEKERLMKELENLRMSSSVAIPTVPVGDEGQALGSPGAEDDPYQVMKSIAFQPLDTNRQRTTSIRIKDITGGGGEEVSIHSDTSSTPPVAALRFSPSPARDDPLAHSPELPLLSPATGQHNAVSTHLSGSPLAPEMKQLLQTYEIVDSSGGVPYVKRTHPVDVSDGAPDFNTSSAFNLGCVRHNMALFQIDNGLSASCPHVTGTDQPDSSAEFQ